MKQGQRLNPFSVADTDHVLRCSQWRFTDLQICASFKRLRKRGITIEEVRRICEEAGKRVKIDQRRQ